MLCEVIDPAKGGRGLELVEISSGKPVYLGLKKFAKPGTLQANAQATAQANA